MMEKLKKNFNKNMDFFKEKMGSLYDFYREYTPKNIKTIEENGEINLKSQNNHFIYPKNAQASVLEQVSFYFKDPLRIVSLSNDTKVEKEVFFLHEHYIELIQDIAKKFTPITPEFYTDHSYIPCLVIIGVGLGYHIEKIIQEHEILNLFIFEPEPDLFYSSLFTLDYHHLLNRFYGNSRSLTIQVGMDKSDFINGIGKKMSRQGYFSSSKIYFYKHYNSTTAQDTLETLKNVTHRLFQGWGFFEDELISISHSIKNLAKNPYAFINKNKSMRDIPAIIIGNGPSLDQDIEFIKKNADKFIIFSSGSALKPLYKANIIPDFHVEIERTKLVYDWILDIDQKNYTKKIILIGLNTLYPETSNFFKDFYWCLKSTDAGNITIKSIVKNNQITELNNCTATVVNGAVEFALLLGFQKIFLFGVDMGFKDPKYHHSKHSGYAEKNSQFYKEMVESTRETEGNFSKIIFSNNEFDYSRFMLEEQIKRNNRISFYNCSDGAKIAGAKPEKSHKIENFIFIDLEKETLLKEIKDFHLSKIEMEDQAIIDNEVEKIKKETKKIINSLIETTKNQPKNRADLGFFFTDQFILFNKITEKNELYNVLIGGSLKYMQTQIYSDMINIIKEDEFKKAIKVMLSLFCDYFNSMIDLIENQLMLCHGEFHLDKHIINNKEKYSFILGK